MDSFYSLAKSCFSEEHDVGFKCGSCCKESAGFLLHSTLPDNAKCLGYEPCKGKAKTSVNVEVQHDDMFRFNVGDMFAKGFDKPLANLNAEATVEESVGEVTGVPRRAHGADGAGNTRQNSVKSFLGGMDVVDHSPQKGVVIGF